jgi:hypothetical protein
VGAVKARVDTPGARARIARRTRQFTAFGCLVTLPATSAALWFLSAVPIRPTQPDIDGVSAVSVGILGIVFHFRFLYKLQGTMQGMRMRIMILALHAAMTAFLFLCLVNIGYDAPWTSTPVWGSYGLADACKSWIIAVLVAGSITLFTGVFDLVREKYLSS